MAPFGIYFLFGNQIYASLLYLRRWYFSFKRNMSMRADMRNSAAAKSKREGEGIEAVA